MLEYSNARSKAGVTLVEIMVALFILGAGFTGLFSGFIQTRVLTQGSIYQNTAISIANSYMEQLKAIEFVALETNPIPNLVHEGSTGAMTTSPVINDFESGANTDVANTFTIDINNTPDVEEDDMTLRIFVYIDDLTDQANGIDESRKIVIRYEADYSALGRNSTFSNVLRSIRSDVQTFL